MSADVYFRDQIYIAKNYFFVNHRYASTPAERHVAQKNSGENLFEYKKKNRQQC